MIGSLAAALGHDAALVVAAPGRATAAVIAELRAAARTGQATSAEAIVLLLDDGLAALDRAMLIAALGPLAVELAPLSRVAALDLAPHAAEEDVIAAARYLASARSTTGQVLRVA